MLLQGAQRPGWTIGVNGFSGNIGVALAAVVTGYLVKHLGWRAAFVAPGLLSIACGVAFHFASRTESAPPAKRRATQAQLPAALLARVFLVMTLAATSGSLLFNFSTNGNYELLHERFIDVSRDPAMLGLLLGGRVHGRVGRAARRGPAHRSLPAEARCICPCSRCRSRSWRSPRTRTAGCSTACRRSS